jgi:AraC-like DNA-binding protein
LEIEMPASSRLLLFSTEMLPERERFSAFREEFARRVLAMDVVDHSAGRPRFDITFMQLGAAGVGTLDGTSAEFIREQHHLKDGSDDFRINIAEAAPIRFAHGGQEGICANCEAYFIDHARPERCRGGHGQAGKLINIAVRAAALKTLVRHPEDLAGHKVRPGPALRLLHGYLRSLTALEEPPPPDLAPIIGTHLLDLAAAALGPTAEARDIIASRGVKAARLRAILSEVARHFSDPNFELDNIVVALGLSRRYVQQLLEETGHSFTEHLLERRLERAFAMLTDPRFLHLPIIDIAFAAGFGDVSHFNRMFRRRFGDTPSGVRAAAIRPENE